MKTLVLLHGWGASPQVWARQVAAFQGRGTVLAPAIPAWEVKWFSRYLEALPLPECLLVGWSLGGMLLLEVLSGGELPPPGGLALVGAAASFCRRPDHPWGQAAGVVRAMRQALPEDAGKVLAAFARRCLAPGETAFQEVAQALWTSPLHPENLVSGLDYLLRVDLRDRLDRLPGPAAIIQGEADEIVSPAQAQYLHERLPGSRLHLLPGAGHVPMVTQAARFNVILADMLRGGPAAGGSLPPDL